MQMPGPRDIVIYWPDPQAFSVVPKPWGWAHILVQKPRGARGGGMVTGQIDTCIIAAFLDVEKTFDNVWHNGLPTKLCRWLSDFLVGRVIQVKVEGFLSPKVYPKPGVPQGSNLSPLLFFMSMTWQIQVATRLTSRNLQMTPTNGP